MTNSITAPVTAGRCLCSVLISAPRDLFNGVMLTALVDTGATRSAVTMRAAEFVGLPAIGQTILSSAAVGAQSIPTWGADLELWAPGFSEHAARRFSLEIVTLLRCPARMF